MEKLYVGDSVFVAAIQHMEKVHGPLRTTSGSHWRNWFLGDEQVASYSVSCYPGPAYGEVTWVSKDLVGGDMVSVRRSRGVTETEAHFLNKRLEYMRRGLYQPREDYIELIPEIEVAFKDITSRTPLPQRIEKDSFQVYWYEVVQL